MQRSRRKRNATRCPRTGMAPIEFVMGLPLLMILLLAMLTVCGFGITQTSVEIRARQDSWSERFAPRSAQQMPVPKLDSLTQVLGSNIMPPPDGGLHQSVEVDTAVSLGPYLFERSAERRAGHELLADAWDYRTIDVEHSRDEQPPLFATFRVDYFRLSIPFRRDAFAALGELGGSAGDASRLDRGATRAGRGEGRLADAIAQVQDEIARVQSALDRARGEPMPDQTEIDRLRRELDSLQKQLDVLRNAEDVIDSEDPRAPVAPSES